MMKKFLIFGILAAILVPSMIGYVKKSKEMTKDQSMIVCLSGRGDKDVNTIAAYIRGEGYLN